MEDTLRTPAIKSLVLMSDCLYVLHLSVFVFAVSLSFSPARSAAGQIRLRINILSCFTAEGHMPLIVK